MSANRIRAWLGRIKPDANLRIQLVHEQMGLTSVVSNWAPAELVHGDGATLVLDAAQEHCDDLGVQARYNLQLVDADNRVVASKPIRLQPDEDGEERPLASGQVEDPTIAGALHQLMRHNEVTTRMYVGAMGSVLGNMQQMLKLQSEQIAALNQQVQEANRRAKVAERRASDGETEEESAESLAKAEAYTKMADAVATHLIPVLGGMLMSNGRADQPS